MVWKRYRRSVELLQALFLTGLPFVRINGESALRFDIGHLSLCFFGSLIRISEFYLILAVVLSFLLFITFVTSVFGRIWCGWLCPQTVLLDLAGTLAAPFGKKHREIIRKILLLPLSALVALTMIWYFVPPAETMKALFVSVPVTGFFIVLTTTIFIELAFIGRIFCTSACPYAMMQNALFDKDTLVIEYDLSRDDTCMKCDECVRACPVGIDIKQGLDSRCIACAECIDACATISRKRDIPPFPDYKGRVLRPKTFLMGGITAAAGLMTALLIWTRPPVEFLVARNQESLPAGLNRYSCTITNNTGKSLELMLSMPEGTTLIGQRTFSIKPYAIQKSRILIKADGRPERVKLTLKGEGVSITREAGFL